MSRALRLLLGLVALMVGGCAEPLPANPSFSVTFDEARVALREMKQHPRALDRPLVLVGGFGDPHVSATYYQSLFGDLTGDRRVLAVVVGFCSSFEECRRKIIKAVDEAWPNDDPLWTSEVDVIGASLGGLAARYAAAPSLDEKRPRRLRIARLFSICSPHTGAELARHGGVNSLQDDMRPGSVFLARLATSDGDAGYELYPYARLRDHIVGERFAAPPGANPLWLPTPPLEGGHSGAWHDPRILADIARRLRDERPFSALPAMPLPQM